MKDSPFSNMKRRDFLTTSAAVPAALAAQSASAATTASTGRMKLGTQSTSTPLNVLAALGVENICSGLPSAKFDEKWSVEGLTKLREGVEKFGIKLDLVPLPLSSAYITRSENPNIMLG